MILCENINRFPGTNYSLWERFLGWISRTFWFALSMWFMTVFSPSLWSPTLSSDLFRSCFEGLQDHWKNRCCKKLGRIIWISSLLWDLLPNKNYLRTQICLHDILEWNLQISKHCCRISIMSCLIKKGLSWTGRLRNRMIKIFTLVSCCTLQHMDPDGRASDSWSILSHLLLVNPVQPHPSVNTWCIPQTSAGGHCRILVYGRVD